MKEIKIYKVNKRPIIWGLSLSLFYVFIAITTILAFTLIAGITLLKFIICVSLIALTYVVLKTLSGRDIIDKAMNEKLPDRIINSL